MTNMDNLFPTEKAWQAEWQGMPEFVQPCKESVMSVMVHFETFEDMRAFAALIDARIAPTTKSLFFPVRSADKKVYVNEP
jgi:hypothetical protein